MCMGVCGTDHHFFYHIYEAVYGVLLLLLLARGRRRYDIVLPGMHCVRTQILLQRVVGLLLDVE